jgi:hypothetical protein
VDFRVYIGVAKVGAGWFGDLGAGYWMGLWAEVSLVRELEICSTETSVAVCCGVRAL